MVARLRDCGVARGALKRGAAGPVCFEGTHCGQSFAPAERVVDSTAAGDSFNGAYLARRLSGGSAGEALSAGHACAALVVGFAGAIG